VLLSAPAPAAAQRDVFVEGIVELTAAAAGTFGDEGPRIRSALTRMTDGLADRDRSIGLLESREAPEPPAAALQRHVTLGDAYLERGRLGDALRELEEAIRLDPRRADVHLRLGLALRAAGRTADAARAFHAAWDLDRLDPVTTYHAVTANPAANGLRLPHDAVWMAYRGLVEETFLRRTAFRRSGLIDETTVTAPVVPPAAYARGYALLEERAYDEALAELRRAALADPLLTDPAVALAPMRLGIAALRQGRLEEARRQLESAIVAAPRSSEAHRVLGLVYWAASHYDRSLGHLETAIRLNPADERSRIAQGRVLIEAGRVPDAQRALQATLDALPDSRLAHWWLSWVYESLNGISRARHHLEQAAGPGMLAGRARLWAAIGRLARVEGDFTIAVEAFGRAVSANPDDAAAHKGLARAYLDQDRTDEALQELLAACVIVPRDADVHAAVGRIHLDAGRHEDAALALRRALALKPDHLEARYALGATLTRMGDAAGAAREMDTFAEASARVLAARRHNMSVDVLIEEAALRTAEGWHDRAAALWHKVVEADPGKPAHVIGLATALANAGRLHEAIQQYEAAAPLAADPDVYRRLAELYATAGRPGDSARARAMSDRLLQVPPGPGDGR
jgi:tetratricopeptide (TPR) repeat protein